MHVRAVGAGLAVPAAAGPIFGQLTCANYRMSFGGLFNCCSKSSYASDSCHPQDFCWGWRKKHFVAWRKFPSKRKFWGTTLICNRSHANTRAITAAKTIKNAYSNAPFSSISAATESLQLSNSGFKTALKKQFESSSILELGYQAACGGRGGRRAQEHYARALCCNTAGPFQICFLWACMWSKHV